MLSLASTHAALLETYQGQQDEGSTSLVRKSWHDIVRVAQIMAEGAECHLSDEVMKELRGNAIPEGKPTSPATG
jgi:hypothetical protein